MYKIELVTSEGVVVGLFEVALNISMAALACWVKEAVRLRRESVRPYWVKETVRVNSDPVIAWQVRRPDNRILCQVKVQGVCTR